MLDAAVSSHGSPEEQLTTILAKIPDVQCLASSYLTQRRDISAVDIRKLICRTRELDQDLSGWARDTPGTWAYSAALDATTPGEARFTPTRIHRYPDYYIARVWNLYRVSRLIVQSILLRALRWLSAPTETYAAGPEWIGIERSAMELVTDICASVPFLLGHDLSKMKLPATVDGMELGNIRHTVSSKDGKKDDGAIRAGRYSLLWPLYVASSAPRIPEAQRAWMRLQLRFIAEHGESQARCLCHTESQLLLGGAEKFGFDCV